LLLGSSELLGNPVGLLRNLATGVSDFFYEPGKQKKTQKKKKKKRKKKKKKKTQTQTEKKQKKLDRVPHLIRFHFSLPLSFQPLPPPLPPLPLSLLSLSLLSLLLSSSQRWVWSVTAHCKSWLGLEEARCLLRCIPRPG